MCNVIIILIVFKYPLGSYYFLPDTAPDMSQYHYCYHTCDLQRVMSYLFSSSVIQHLNACMDIFTIREPFEKYHAMQLLYSLLMQTLFCIITRLYCLENVVRISSSVDGSLSQRVPSLAISCRVLVPSVQTLTNVTFIWMMTCLIFINSIGLVIQYVIFTFMLTGRGMKNETSSKLTKQRLL